MTDNASSSSDLHAHSNDSNRPEASDGPSPLRLRVPLPSRTQTRSISYHEPQMARSLGAANTTTRNSLHEGGGELLAGTSLPTNATSYNYWSQLRTGIATAAALRSAQVEREARRRNRRHAQSTFSSAMDYDDMGDFLQGSGKRRLGTNGGVVMTKTPSGRDESWQPLAHLFDTLRSRKSTGVPAGAAQSRNEDTSLANAESDVLPSGPETAAPIVAEEPESWLDSDRDRIPYGQDPLAFTDDRDLLDSDSEDDDDGTTVSGDDARPVKKASHTADTTALSTLTRLTVASMAALPVFSPLTKGILKCVAAYFIASLFTYNFPLANFMAHLLPNHDPDALVPFGSLHMIATIAVYFHPARSFGSMIEADIFALGAFAYTTFLGLTSMLVAERLHDWGHPDISNLITVVVFVGLGTGIVGYVKVKMNKPTFNTACSLIFVSTFTVVVKEGSTHLGRFETDAIWQVMIVVVTGTLIANLVSFTLWPTSATTNLNNDIARLLDAYSTLLKLLTRTFLLDDPAGIHIKSSQVHAAISAHHSAYTSLQKNLAEAKFEALFDRRIKGLTPAVTELVSCLHRLGQHLGGLRNSCGLQSDILFGGTRKTPKSAANGTANASKKKLNGDAVNVPEQFRTFLDAIGPHMRSLVFICSRSLRELESHSGPKAFYPASDTTIFDELESDIVEAVRRFKHEQTVALKSYNDHTLEPGRGETETVDNATNTQGEESILVIFFFIFTLEEFALELKALIRNMREIHATWRERQGMSWWQWLSGARSARRAEGSDYSVLGNLARLFSLKSNNSSSSSNTLDFPSNSRHAPNTAQTPRIVTRKQRFLHSLWRIGEFFRQRDVKFAIKAGAGCALLASPAFMHTTRPTFKEYKGEWALISFMVVLNPTVGQSNQMGVHRVAGTIVGAVVAAVAYYVFPDNNVALPLIGALFSVPCFRYIVGKPALASTGRFVLLTFNLTALYSYNVRKTNVEAEQVAFQRTVAVTIGVIWATMLNHLLWPNEARRELTLGLSDLLFKLSWLYQCLSTRTQRSPVIPQPSSNAAILESQPLLPTQPVITPSSSYQSMELHLQFQLIRLESLLAQTTNEPRLKGPFPVSTYRRILVTCTGVLDQLHSLRCIVQRKEWKLLLDGDVSGVWKGKVGKWRREMVGNILLFFHILASSLSLKTPLPPYLPPAESSRLSLLEAMHDLPMIKKQAWRAGEVTQGDKAYLLIWSYCLCNRQVIRGLQELGAACREAFGVVGGGELNLGSEQDDEEQRRAQV